LKEHLQPIVSDEGQKIKIPPAPYSMGYEQKDIFLKVFKEAKLPYGCASNISRCVQVKERRFTGYKSYDAHIRMH